jgi:hypothetical protein
MVFTLEIKIKGLEGFRNLTRNIPKMNITLNKEVRKKVGQTLIDELRKEVVRQRKVVTKHLFDDIYSREVNPNETRVYFGKPRSRYAGFVDVGSLNKKPPSAEKTTIGYSVYRWVTLKGLKATPRYRTYGKNTRKYGQTYGKPFTPTQRQLAYIIAKHLSQEKTEATHITRKAFSKADWKIKNIINEEVDRIMKIYGL